MILCGFLAAASVCTLDSCTSKNAAEQEGADEGEALKLKIENCTNVDSIKMYARQAREYAEKLEAAGKGEEAASYLTAVLPAIQQKDSTAVSEFDNLKSAALKEVANAKEAAAKADSIAKAKKDELKDSVNSKVGAAKDAAKDAATKAVNDAADKATTAATDAANKATDKAKDAAKDAAKKVFGN